MSLQENEEMDFEVDYDYNEHTYLINDRPVDIDPYIEEEEIGYSLHEVDNYVQELMVWFAETYNIYPESDWEKSRKERNLKLMFEDIRTLMSAPDEYCLVSLVDNKIVLESLNPDFWAKTLKKIYDLSKKEDEENEDE